MKNPTIKNYSEYIKALKESFGDYDGIPSESDISSFIASYDLDRDWDIEASDVRLDFNQIVKGKRHNQISSYSLMVIITLRMESKG